MSRNLEDFPSNGSAQYARGRVSVPNDSDKQSVNMTSGDTDGGYMRSRTVSTPDISYRDGCYSKLLKRKERCLSQQLINLLSNVCDSCGLLRDRWGYLILSNDLGGKLEGGKQEYFKPVRRPSYSKFRKTKSQRVCGRPLIITIVFVILVLAASIGGNIYQYLQKSPESDDFHSPKTMCPKKVSFLPGQIGEISCSVQYYSNTTSLAIDVYFNSEFMTDTQTYLSQETLDLPTGNIRKNLSEHDAIVEITVQDGGVLELGVKYEQVLCCNSGKVSINISGSLVLTIEVNVGVNMPCPGRHLHTIGQVNSISCTRCVCGNASSSGLNTTTWYFYSSSDSVNQSGRIWQDQSFDESTGLMTNRLVFNRTACFDHGLYILEIVDFVGQVARLNFTIQTNGYNTNNATSSQEVVRLLTAKRISIEVCLDNEPMAFLHDHNLTYTFSGDDGTVEFLQAENISAGDVFRGERIGVILAGQQNVVLRLEKRSLQIRTNYYNGIVRFDLEFNKVQCFHGGVYLFFRNGSLLYNLSVTTDETFERTQTEIYQKSEVTGFVETYNITMECAARVGCTKRSYVMEPVIGSNTTYDYSLMDVNADNIMDVFIATITTTVVNISMALNDTDFTCKVTADTVTQEKIYQIYVLDGTFCDSRPKNCEYFYPYQTLQTCKNWVSCLDDRPRVKFCDFDNLYYHKSAGQCAGRCEITCPWNL